MIHLANLCLFSLLLVNLLGLALVTGLWLRNAWLALTAGPWLFCSIFFFIESFRGLGNLGWMWPFTTAISLWILLEVTGKTHILLRWGRWLRLEDWQRELSPRLVPVPYITFLLLFSYPMLWRYVFPNIDASSEKIADLAFVCSYYSGDTLPVKDVWFYPFLSTNYYSFQYYAAALLGRILGIEPGAAYNISFCVLIGMTFTAGVGVIWLQTTKRWIRFLVSAGWIFGGSGVTILIHFLVKDAPVWDNFRFIGSAILNKDGLGKWVNDYQQEFIPPGATVPMELPGEQMSYSTYLGDYHPPLSGFYLLALALLAFFLRARGGSPWVLFIAAATLPWCAVADTWNLPLMVLGLGAWVSYNYRDVFADDWRFFIHRYTDTPEQDEVRRRQPFTGSWRYLLGGAIAAMVAIYPYFLVFSYSAENYHTVLRWVPAGFHTPPLLWLVFLLPTFGLTILALTSRDKLLSALGIVCWGYLFFTEFFFINDIYSGAYIRFNTTLKWWPWVEAITLLLLAPKLLEMKTALWRWCVTLVLVIYPICYVYDLARAWVYLPHDHIGALNGSAFYDSTEMLPDGNRKTSGERPLLDYLKMMPKGLTIERPEDDFTSNASMTLFAGQPSYLGWLGHEQLWRGYLPEFNYRHDNMKALYEGNLPNAGDWLNTQDIDYILWFKKDDIDPTWDKVNASIGTQYYFWHEFYHEYDRRYGMWQRKKTAP